MQRLDRRECDLFTVRITQHEIVLDNELDSEIRVEIPVAEELERT